MFYYNECKYYEAYMQKNITSYKNCIIVENL